MTTTKWKGVALPGELYELIAKIKDQYGYRSVNGFVVDSVRRRLEEFKAFEPSKKPNPVEQLPQMEVASQ